MTMKIINGVIGVLLMVYTGPAHSQVDDFSTSTTRRDKEQKRATQNIEMGALGEKTTASMSNIDEEWEYYRFPAGAVESMQHIATGAFRENKKVRMILEYVGY
jgi:hypothetical protein